MLCSWGLAFIQLCGMVQSLSGQPTIGTGNYHSICAFSSSGVLKCWGSNNYGQLGQADTVSRGNYASQVGDNLTAIELGLWKKTQTQPQKI
eukprot:2518702-Amphidinium_carterae.1